jgi:hypothetical protein
MIKWKKSRENYTKPFYSLMWVEVRHLGDDLAASGRPGYIAWFFQLDT